MRPLLQHGDVAAQHFRFLQVMRGEHNGMPLGVKPTDELPGSAATPHPRLRLVHPARLPAACAPVLAPPARAASCRRTTCAYRYRPWRPDPIHEQFIDPRCVAAHAVVAGLNLDSVSRTVKKGRTPVLAAPCRGCDAPRGNRLRTSCPITFAVPLDARTKPASTWIEAWICPRRWGRAAQKFARLDAQVHAFQASSVPNCLCTPVKFQWSAAS